MRSQKTMQMAEVALMSAVLCVLAPMAIPIPFSPIPLTLGTFAVYLTAVLLGPKKGTFSVLIYLLIGMVGLPVFSGFSGGIGVLAGPTGGYLIGYVPCMVVIGVLAGRRRKPLTILWNGFAMALGTLVCYLFGMAWFLVVMNGTYTVTQALFVCVVPYLAFDFVKIFAAAVLAVPVRKVLKHIRCDRT